MVSGIKDQGLDPDVSESEDEDEMLKKAIAMSLEEETGVILQKEISRLSTITFRWQTFSFRCNYG